MSDKNEGNMIDFNDLIALASVKTKKTSSDGSISDLFKCVESLATATETLRDYTGTISDPNYRGEIAKYLTALSKIQDGLLEIAQNKIRGLSQMPAFSSQESEDEGGKIGKA